MENTNELYAQIELLTLQNTELTEKVTDLKKQIKDLGDEIRDLKEEYDGYESQVIKLEDEVEEFRQLNYWDTPANQLILEKLPELIKFKGDLFVLQLIEQHL